MQNINYKKYLFEILAIVIGITLSFMVEEWRDQSNQKKKVDQYLKAIQKDLENEILFHKQDSLEVLLNRQYCRNLEAFINDEYRPDDSVTFLLEVELIGRITNRLQVHTSFDELNESGLLSRVEDDTLRTLLQIYYNEEQREYWNDINKERFYNLLTAIHVHIPLQVQEKILFEDSTAVHQMLSENPKLIRSILTQIKEDDKVKKSINVNGRQYFFAINRPTYFMATDIINRIKLRSS